MLFRNFIFYGYDICQKIVIIKNFKDCFYALKRARYRSRFLRLFSKIRRIVQIIKKMQKNSLAINTILGIANSRYYRISRRKADLEDRVFTEAEARFPRRSPSLRRFLDSRSSWESTTRPFHGLPVTVTVKSRHPRGVARNREKSRPLICIMTRKTGSTHVDPSGFPDNFR